MKPAVFLDRDGTMIHEVGYLARREDVRWLPATIDAIRLLKRAGYLVFVTTNQGGIGLGYFPESFVTSLHAELNAHLTRCGAEIAGWFHCPHHPRAVVDQFKAACTCRKPGRGMADQAAAQHEIDFARSFAIGDRPSDVELGLAFGGRGIMVRTGHGEGELARSRGVVPGASLIAHDLMEATSWILRAS